MSANSLRAVLLALRGQRFDLHNEKVLQRQLADVLRAEGLLEDQEYRLSPQSIIDFMGPEGLGIEVKINGGKKDIFRQCERYCLFPEITSLLLLTNKQMGLPALIEGKPVCVFNLGLAWL